jgi:glutamate synthase (NADPH/NADH) large chain
MEGMEQNVHHLRGLIEAHARETGSRWAAEIGNDFRTFLGRFWLVKPKAAAIDMLIESLRRAA